MKPQYTPEPGRLAELRAAIPRLHAWFRASARDLPWRRSADPYSIWVSEVMLQQTQVATVIPYYRRFLERLPDVRTLAFADEEVVLGLWEGLGYYSRARHLQQAAREVMNRYGGRIPDAPERFGELPGVGTYTKAAVLSLAFGLDLAAVDGNVRRVLGRLEATLEDVKRPAVVKRLEVLAQALLPSGTAAVHNQAMMELGATLCMPRRPACPTCPLSEVCRARATGRPEAYPPRVRKAPIPHRELGVALVCNEHGEILIQRRPYDGFLGGLWELPGGELRPDETVEQTIVRMLGPLLGPRLRVGDPLPVVEHAYSHFTVTLHPRLCFLDGDPAAGPSMAAEGRPMCWASKKHLRGHPMSRADRKVLAVAEAHGPVQTRFLLDPRGRSAGP